MLLADPHGHLPFDGADNVRDLGGHPLPGGGRTARGRVLRADALTRLSDADVRRLAEFGVRTVVDLRTPMEVDTNGRDRLPDGVRTVHLPVGGGNLGVFYEVIGSRDAERQRAAFAEGRLENLMIDINRTFVRDETERGRFAEAVRLVADPAAVPLLFHCTAGKDRTGWLAAVLLAAAGVDRATIMADFLRSDDYLRHTTEKILAAIAELGQMAEPELLRPLLEQQPAYLEAAFNEADALFGSFDGFLREGMGLDDATLDALRQNLT
ncbi:tyrosine-protein phosphatase [Actinomadura logoneensis]|uniref:Tyrosine-protein phosphatase n=1 Tax=Actinomadura logoneensis TaxID=2293572 RepID=A0A372JCK0_9ACTN|nr:tyrosine-protein phosphatase [Actinomadura logoneensis]RFU37556.1 tyrosine-protein phosphatase [Actinomadura logoneensis]